MSPPDRDLIRRFVEQRADDAFTELTRRHVDLVYRAALRKVGNPHLAEDVTQAVFTALAWKAPSLLRHRTIIGWLHTATRFAAYEALRTENRRRRHEQEASALHEHSMETAGQIEWERLRPIVDDVLGELKESDREAVLLRFFEALPFGAVGAALGVSENTARMRVDRALGKLHALLARRGITSTSSALAMALAAHATAVAVPTALAASVTGAALASCTAASGAVATTTIFMSVSKIQAGLAVAAALVVGVALYEGRVARGIEVESRIARTNVAAAIAKRTALERTLQDAQRERSALQRAVASSRSNISGGSPAAIVAPAVDSQMEIIRDRYLQRRAVARSDPEYQRLEAAQRKLEAGQHYGPLYQRLKLSADRIAAFESIMAEHAQIFFDIDAAAETKRVPAWDSSVEKLKVIEKDRLGEKLRELLGDENYVAFQQYEQSSTLRSSVTGMVAVALYATATPLSATQAEALTGILDRHARFERDGSKDASGVNWPAAFAEAERVLAPAQIEALRGAYAQRRWSDTLAAALSPMVGAQPPK